MASPVCKIEFKLSGGECRARLQMPVCNANLPLRPLDPRGPCARRAGARRASPSACKRCISSASFASARSRARLRAGDGDAGRAPSGLAHAASSPPLRLGARPRAPSPRGAPGSVARPGGTHSAADALRRRRSARGRSRPRPRSPGRYAGRSRTAMSSPVRARVFRDADSATHVRELRVREGPPAPVPSPAASMPVTRARLSAMASTSSVSVPDRGADRSGAGGCAPSPRPPRPRPARS